MASSLHRCFFVIEKIIVLMITKKLIISLFPSFVFDFLLQFNDHLFNNYIPILSAKILASLFFQVLILNYNFIVTGGSLEYVLFIYNFACLILVFTAHLKDVDQSLRNGFVVLWPIQRVEINCFRVVRQFYPRLKKKNLKTKSNKRKISSGIAFSSELLKK